jgi:3-oxoacyl-[acyl-carrier protein] reductase
MKGHGLLEGKVVVITAAAGTGIGGAAARRCLEEGARVAISDQHTRRLAATRDELAQAHAGLVWAQSCDVTDEAQVAALIEGAAGHFGRIDVMINNAGPGQAHYAAAKAGVMAFTRCAALDVAGHGIRVNAVAPSLAIHPFLAKVTSEDLLAELAGREGFGRAAQPWEVANVMVFLASDYASPGTTSSPS